MRAFERSIASGFDIDEFGIARAELTSFRQIGLASRFLSKRFCRLRSVDHRLSLPSYQPVILASSLDRSVIQYIRV